MAKANIILVKEINNEFTNIVNKYLGQGMTFHTGSMAGSQGEIAKVDLTDGTDVYRINMDKETSYEDDIWGDKVVIKVERFAGQDDSNDLRGFRTIWTGKGEQVEVHEWWQADGRQGRVWVATKEEAIELSKKRHERYKRSNRCRRDNEKEIAIRTIEQKEFLKAVCREHKGYKSICKRHIDKLIKTTYSDGDAYYRVTFNNGKESLTIKRMRTQK